MIVLKKKYQVKKQKTFVFYALKKIQKKQKIGKKFIMEDRFLKRSNQQLSYI